MNPYNEYECEKCNWRGETSCPDHYANGTFVEKIKVTDQWASGGEKFRLVDRGAGPRELQIDRDGRWVAENPQYIHGVLCARIEFLANSSVDGK